MAHYDRFRSTKSQQEILCLKALYLPSGWEPRRTSTDYADGFRRLRDRINGIEVSAASHGKIYCKVMEACQDSPKNPSTSVKV
ncbi:hypothetical protein AYI69_g7738 [Smittium culicis]|uniref:Uncharacterized protein n=1 Tax=Smittium culicis TaxID=133412 RepID=A0A1R1XPX8_9FUNG|nr:hypothetical protein AYI69_g7738 [Smittium culicis]